MGSPIVAGFQHEHALAIYKSEGGWIYLFEPNNLNKYSEKDGVKKVVPDKIDLLGNGCIKIKTEDFIRQFHSIHVCFFDYEKVQMLTDEMSPLGYCLTADTCTECSENEI